MDYSLLIKEVSRFATGYFARNANPALLYHNVDHTVNVVRRVIEIGSNYSLRRADMFVLEAAAWFHDSGQLSGNGKDHEEISVSIMKDYFQHTDVPKAAVEAIERCILATRIPHKPTSFRDGIICDADTYNLGTDAFPNTDALLKREYALRGLPTKDWDKNTLAFLTQHRYFTGYCKWKLNETKGKNIAMVQGRFRNGSFGESQS